ncbi:Pr6Pr family membrane protein [Phycicoccus flavus]|uniref:Pr6Pr family membrane protein n=1 Tax=Phycicoccus flavus TaxID=2502783 RepID=UPI000FEB65B4|nr:Pr6Pr family membrane protein [Phycicoccus flavus]NHA69502.1 hypothetical protein [Phycicoccus flavus]
MVDEDAGALTGWRRTAVAVNAGLAWLGVALTVAVSAVGGYRATTPPPGLYGAHPDGAAGVLSRVADTLSYFTIWSNVVVALSVTLLLRRPVPRGLAVRVLRLDALLMITVTAIVYQVLLAPTADVVGWSLLTDPILHVLTPIVTVVVWVAVGPRGWVSARLVPLALVLPVAWIGWMLARGAVVGAYPYGFANVTELGYPAVLRTLALILVFGLVVAALYWGLDALLGRRRTRRP